ncbi:MAG: hypothetical protein IJD22_02915 [Clostridia bacterium]|nr:hypothetical protein [Clostridia bacterium]
MDNNRKLQIYCLFAASLFMGIFGAVCLYMGLGSEYNDAMGHFNVGSLFAPVVYCCIAAGPILGIAGWVLFAKGSLPDRPLPRTVTSKAVSIIAAALVSLSSVLELSSNINGIPGSATTLAKISSVLGLALAAYLIVSAFTGKDNAPRSALVSLLGFCAVIYCATKVLLLYFDQSVAVNSPLKLICQLNYLSYMLALTAQTGLTLGRGRLLPRYIFALCTAIAVGGTGAIAAVAVRFTNVQCSAFAGEESFAKIGLFIYMCVQLVMLTRADADFTSPQKKGAGSEPIEEVMPADGDEDADEAEKEPTTFETEE